MNLLGTMPSAREAHLNGTASTRVLTTMLETVVELASTTPSPFHITKNESSVANKTTSAPNELMTRRGFFMHMVREDFGLKVSFLEMVQ